MLYLVILAEITIIVFVHFGQPMRRISSLPPLSEGYTVSTRGGAGASGPYASRYASRRGFGGRRPSKNIFVVRDFASFAGKISHDKVSF